MPGTAGVAQHRGHPARRWAASALVPVMLFAAGAAAADETIPDFRLRVMRGGTELEIAGGLRAGIAERAEKLLAAHPAVTVVHLNSTGGVVKEGLDLFHLFRGRKLDTYVSNICFSACTVAFAGGRERYALDAARIGFHEPINEGGPLAGVGIAKDELRRAYDAAGFNRALVERGLKVPHADLWTPTRDELTAAGVVTGYVDGGRFSASGWGVSVTPATVREEFRKSSPVYAALERSQPGQARELYARVAKLYGRGATSDELFGMVSLRVHELVQPRFANAPDGPILQFGRAIARQFAELQAKDPGMCWQVMRAGSTPAVTALLSEAAQRDERDALVAILQSPATGRTLSKSGQARVMVALRRIVEGRITPAQFALLDRPEIAPADRPDYCVAIAAILDGILQLPERDAAGLLRTFLGQNN